MDERTLVILGPTASGKTSLAVALAHELGDAEVVNADSMLVYRGMDIGTAKPSLAERAGVPHHLIDIFDITRTATVAEFQQLARECIADCHRRGITPIVVGGSALYVRAIVDRFEFPGTDPTVRQRWEAELERRGSAALYAELVQRAPDAEGQVLPGNGRRIVRALEILELTGSWRAALPSNEYQLPGVRQFGLDIPRDVLDDRIRRRVDLMWQQGLVEEVRALADAGLRDGLTASRALGYRQVLEFLDGQCTEAEAREQTVVRTRQFARKQLGWFRRDERIEWFATRGDAPNSLVTELMAAL